MKLRNILLGMLAIGALAACNDAPTPTVVTGPTSAATTAATPVATVAAVPTRPQVTTPIFNFLPRRGAPGTVVNIRGGNYKPGSKVIIRLGIPQPQGEALASVDVDAGGKWAATVTIPGTLASGKEITADAAGDVQLVAMDENNNVLGSEPFGFVAKGQSQLPPTQAADPAETVRAFMTALQSDPTGAGASKYLSARLKSDTAAGTPLPAMLSGTVKQFTVGTTTIAEGKNDAVVKVSIDFGSGPQNREVTLVRALNVWGIDSIGEPKK